MDAKTNHRGGCGGGSGCGGDDSDDERRARRVCVRCSAVRWCVGSTTAPTHDLSSRSAAVVVLSASHLTVHECGVLATLRTTWPVFHLPGPAWNATTAPFASSSHGFPLARRDEEEEQQQQEEQHDDDEEEEDGDDVRNARAGGGDDGDADADADADADDDRAKKAEGIG